MPRCTDRRMQQVQEMNAGVNGTQLRVLLLISGLLLTLGAKPSTSQVQPHNPDNNQLRTAELMESYAHLPLSFEANEGQSDGRVRFISRGSGYGIYLTNDGAVLSLTRSNCDEALVERVHQPSQAKPPCKRDRDTVTMHLEGTQQSVAAPTGENQLPGTSNYFVGGADAWRTGLPTFAKVRYPQVYPGVDLVFYGNQRQLEYDFVVAPDADPKAIRLQFAGANKLKLNDAGDLVVSAKYGDIAFRKPVIYQEANGRREWVDGRFTLGKRHTVGFTLDDYDPTRPIVIDPVLGYSTYLGGSGTNGDSATAIAVDASGEVYIAGITNSTNFPVTSGSDQQTNAGSATSTNNAFIAKLNAAGSALVYSTYLGGNGNTQAFGLAVDASGDAYVTGTTFATNFPTTSGAFQTATKASSTGYNAFVTKLNATGTALAYSTYLGGSGNGNGTGDQGNGIAVDASGEAYVAGYTYSSNFPVTTGAFQTTNNAVGNAIEDGFVTKLNATGTALVYSTFLGGSGAGLNGEGDLANAVALDSAGDAYVTGEAGSPDFPTTAGAYQTTNLAANNTQANAFVAKINPAGSGLLYSTYLGGSKNASGSALAIDSSDNVYVTGFAYYTDFPVSSGAYQTTNKAATLSAGNAFVSKLNSTGSALIYSTWLGGSGVSISTYNNDGDAASGIALDSAGDAYVTGISFSSNFPVTSGAYQVTNGAAANKSYNAFVTELNPTGTGLVYSTYLGGSGTVFGTMGYYRGDDGLGVALDSSGNIYVAGLAFSSNYPVTSGPLQSTNKAIGNSGSNAFVTKILMVSSIATTTTVASSANPQTAGTSVTFTAQVAPTQGSTVPTGSVVFKVDGTTAATVTLGSGGSATYSTSALAAGSHTVTASYGGSSNFGASTSSALTETVNAPAAVSPAMSPAVGTYTTAQSVTLTDATIGATIYYTTNGTTPTTSSTKYTAAIAVSATETIEAIAVASGYTNSTVASGTYTITPTAATPTFSVAAGTYTTAQTVSLSDATSGATIYYTTNGTTPTTSSTKYSSAISVSATETVEAIAVASGYTNSSVASAKYTITPTAATPTFSVAAGTYTTAQTVSLSDATSGATIYYTTNGTTPTTSSTKYSSAISVSATETVEAISVASGYTNSAVASATYNITPTAATPTFSVAAGTYTTTQTVSISDTTSGATIYYTTNGTTPTTSSTKYSAAISVSATETVEAIAVATGYSNSVVASAKYTITPVAATPTFSLAAGTYPPTQTLTISDATSGATIYYTTNGTTPTTSSTKYSSAISVSATETVEAIAVATGYNSSAPASAKYTIAPATATPTFSVAAGTYTTAQKVTISDATSGATIYYTTNGTAPTTSSTKYTGAITVSATEMLKAIALATGDSTSAVASVSYTIN